MTTSTPAVNELFRFSQIAYDVGLAFGSTTSQGLDRAKRCLNRAAIEIAGHDRRWNWLVVKDSLITTQDEEEYSLPEDFRKEEMFWIQENGRQKLDRISTSRLRELAPDQSIITGIPRLYDFQGVDSSGCRIATFFPVPSADDIEIFFRYTRHVLPILDDDKDIRRTWGMPPNVIALCLIKKATALAFEGVNSARYFAKTKEADEAIEAAYGSDQSNPDATYQAKLVGNGEQVRGEFLLPPEYDRL